jgi:hypothetical protein
MMTPNLVFVATRMEARPLRRALSRLPRDEKHLSRRAPGAAGPYPRWFITGIGPQAARECATRVLHFLSPDSVEDKLRPHVVLVTGLCGGLLPSIAEGTLVAYTHCLSAEPDRPPLTCSEVLPETYVASLAPRGLAIERLAGVTTAKLVASPADKAALASFGAGVVDMESYPIVEAAQEAGLLVAVLRVVSDAVGRGLPDFNPALKPDGGFSPAAAARIALRSPFRTASLVNANQRALRRLERALEAIFSCHAEGGS